MPCYSFSPPSYVFVREVNARKGIHQEVICSQMCPIQVKRLTNVIYSFLDGSEPAASKLGVVSWDTLPSSTLSAQRR